MKNYLTKLALVAFASMVSVGIVGADQFDKKTIITTDEAMQLPNMTLQPGTYVIRLIDSPPERHIVQFFDKDEKHLVTTIFAIPNERLRPTGKSVFTFWEVPAGQPKALRAWFYPGDDFGQEFAYPKEEAARISAQNNGATVPINNEKAADSISSAPAAEPSNSAAAAEPAPTPTPTATAAPAPAPVPVEIAAAPQASASSAPATIDASSDAQRVAQTTPPDNSLPKTASNLPLIGLLGLLSIVGALALNFAYHRG